MNNKIVNKQISIEKIVDIANYFEDYKEKYDKLFAEDKEKNKNLSFSDRKPEYDNGSTEITYTIAFQNGQTMKEKDFNWFVSNLGDTKIIKEIELFISIRYFGKSDKDDFNSEYNSITASVDFRDAGMNLQYSDVIIDVSTTNQERESNNIYSTIMNTLEDTEDRYNKTIKHRKIRTQCFTISVGIILSYILYIILRVNIDKIPPVLAEYMDNKYILVFGQWFIAIVFGNVLSYWYMLMLYKPLLPYAKYAGYNSSTYRSVYKDDVEEYLQHSEVHFGQFWDAEKRRNRIEKIYKVTKIILLVQLVISVILFLVIK